MFSFLCPKLKLFWTVLDGPYARACRQTNFSEGVLVNNVPFLLFIFFFFFFFFVLLSLFQAGPWPVGGSPSDYTGEMGSQFYVIICQK